MFTAAKKLTNLVWLIDYNKKQLDGFTDDVFPNPDLLAKFKAFGFDAVQIDGHDIDALYDALTKKASDKPIAVILDTVKGKGIKEAEEAASNHSMTMNAETYDRWLAQLRGELAAFAD